MGKRVTDEKLLSVLLEKGSVRETAETLGLNKRTVYTRLQNPDFSAMYAAARDDFTKSAAAALSQKMQDAVNLIYRIAVDMEHEEPRTALQAAEIILRYGLRFTETADIICRLETLEQAQPEGVTNG